MKPTIYTFGRPVENLTEASLIFKDYLVCGEFQSLLRTYDTHPQDMLSLPLDDGECYAFGINTDSSLDHISIAQKIGNTISCVVFSFLFL